MADDEHPMTAAQNPDGTGAPAAGSGCGIYLPGYGLRAARDV